MKLTVCYLTFSKVMLCFGSWKWRLCHLSFNTSVIHGILLTLIHFHCAWVTKQSGLYNVILGNVKRHHLHSHAVITIELCDLLWKWTGSMDCVFSCNGWASSSKQTQLVWEYFILMFFVRVCNCRVTLTSASTLHMQFWLFEYACSRQWGCRSLDSLNWYCWKQMYDITLHNL